MLSRNANNQTKSRMHQCSNSAGCLMDMIQSILQNQNLHLVKQLFRINGKIPNNAFCRIRQIEKIVSILNAQLIQSNRSILNTKNAESTLQQSLKVMHTIIKQCSSKEIINFGINMMLILFFVQRQKLKYIDFDDFNFSRFQIKQDLFERSQFIIFIYLSVQSMSKSLKERSKNLTSISLESFLNDVTTEGQNHNFSELLEHPNIRSIKPQYLQLINLFAFGTYRNYIEGGYDVPKLNQKQIDTLRRLSVLTAFKGAQTITIAKLQQILDLKPEQVIDLLVSMNIIDLITAKIDEEKGIVLILAAELRAEKNSVSKSILNAKISQILEKNKDIEEKIVAIQKQVQ